jgi:hypothetical protein
MTACAAFVKEGSMKCANAIKLYRKSGEAEGSAVLRTLTGNVFRQDGPSVSVHCH